MANSTTSEPPPATASKRKQSSLLRIIATVFVPVIVVLGVAAVMIWLLVRPQTIAYDIESAEAIQNYNLSHNKLNATFNFELRANNPSGRASVYYGRIEVRVLYDNETLAFKTLQPFYQGKRNVTRLGINLVAKDVDLFPNVARNLSTEKNSGHINVDVRAKGKIRFKMGMWKSSQRTLKLLCSPVMVPISPSKNFQSVPCDVDL